MLKASGFSPSDAPRTVGSGRKWSGVGTAKPACGSVSQCATASSQRASMAFLIAEPKAMFSGVA